MENEIMQYNLNAIRNMKAVYDQDQNAAAIDLMLCNLKLLFKKIILMRKQAKEFLESNTVVSQSQVDEKISLVNEETKNLALCFDKTIPPDKRMTNLLYMRIVKEVSYYEKIIPSFHQILPLLEQNYSQQMRTQSYSIVSIYLICEKKFLLEIRILKKKIMDQLSQIKFKSLSNKIKLEQMQCFICNDKNEDKKQLFKQQIKTLVHYESNFDKVVEFIVGKFSENKAQEKTIFHTLGDLVGRKSKTDMLFSDFKEKVPAISLNIYSPLDICNIEIIDFFVPTLKPQDNVDFIYHRVVNRNKKIKKQIKEYDMEYLLHKHRKEQAMKKKIRKSQFRVANRIQSECKNLKKNSLQIVNGFSLMQQNLPKANQRKYLFRTTEFLKPINKKQLPFQRERSISRFRQRFEESIDNCKQNLVKFKINNLSPIVIEPSKTRLTIKVKKKNSLDAERQQNKEKENLIKSEGSAVPKTKSKGKKFQIKPSKNGNKRGRSLKHPNKDHITNKLRL